MRGRVAEIRLPWGSSGFVHKLAFWTSPSLSDQSVTIPLSPLSPPLVLHQLSINIQSLEPFCNKRTTNNTSNRPIQTTTMAPSRTDEQTPESTTLPSHPAGSSSSSSSGAALKAAQLERTKKLAALSSSPDATLIDSDSVLTPKDRAEIIFTDKYASPDVFIDSRKDTLWHPWVGTLELRPLRFETRSGTFVIGLRTPVDAWLGKHRHRGTVTAVTAAGNWGYKEYVFFSFSFSFLSSFFFFTHITS